MKQKSRPAAKGGKRIGVAASWSGFYYDGTVYTDAEEEEMIRKQFNIPM